MDYDRDCARWSAAAARAVKVTSAGLLVLVGLRATTACRSSVEAMASDTTAYQVTIATSQAWAGGSLVLMSKGFRGADTVPLILLGGDTLAMRYAAPDSLLASLPNTQGHFEVRVGFRGRAITLVGSVDLYGGDSDAWTTTPLAGVPVVWPNRSGTTFLMAADAGVALIDLSLRTIVRVIPDSMIDVSCVNGIGPASGGRIAVVYRTFNTCGPNLAVRPDSPSAVPDTGPPRWVQVNSEVRFLVRLGAGHWLAAYHHGVESEFRDSTGAWLIPATAYHVEEPYRAVISPSGDRAVVLGYDGGTQKGLPVWGPTSREPLYMVNVANHLWGAQFSDDGDTLFIAGWAQGADTLVLAALKASDGTVLRSAGCPTNGFDLANLVLDPGRPWFYLVGHTDGYPYQLKVRVVDRATLTLVGTFGKVATFYNGDAYPILSAAERKLYVVDNCSFCYPAAPQHVFTFDLMP